MTSTRLLTVLVKRARSAWPSSTAPRVTAVSPEKMDDVEEAESRSAEDERAEEEEADEPEERAASAGRGKGR